MLKFIILFIVLANDCYAFQIVEYNRPKHVECFELNDNQVRKVLPVPKWFKFNVNKHSAKMNIRIKLN